MSDTCPDCAGEIDFETRTASVRIGTCAHCGHGFTILGATVPSPGPAAAAPAAAGAVEGGAECETCGSTLAFQRAPAGGGIEAICAACGAKTSYLPALERIRAPRMEERPARSFDRDDRSGEAPRTARPCRECGGPLRFTTNPDGTVQGECGSCGNRFTLAPRADGGGGRPERRFDRRSGPPRYGNRAGGWQGGGGGGGGGNRRPPFRSGGAGGRPRRSDNDDDDDGDRAPARRRRKPSSE